MLSKFGRPIGLQRSILSRAGNSQIFLSACLSVPKYNSIINSTLTTENKVLECSTPWCTLLVENAESGGGAPLEAAALEVLLTGSPTALAGLVKELVRPGLL